MLVVTGIDRQEGDCELWLSSPESGTGDLDGRGCVMTGIGSTSGTEVTAYIVGSRGAFS